MCSVDIKPDNQLAVRMNKLSVVKCLYVSCVWDEFSTLLHIDTAEDIESAKRNSMRLNLYWNDSDFNQEFN